MYEVRSPCNKKCKIDPNWMYCLSCKRTLEEIARWKSMTDFERKIVLQILKNRVMAV